MLTVCERRHSFSTHERMFLWKCQSSWDRNVSTWGELEPPTFGFMPNDLTIWAIRARPLLCCPLFFNTGSGGIDIFWRKCNIWNANCAGNSLHFRHRNGCSCESVKVFWDRKWLDLRGTRTPNLRIHAECSNHLSSQGQTFAVPCFWTLALVV